MRSYFKAMLAFVTLLIVYGSLYPWRFDFGRVHANPLWILLHSWPGSWNRFVWRDVGFNIAIYAPFGAAAFRSLGRRMAAHKAILAAVLLGAALSAAMEMLQLYVPSRDCSLLDVFTNGSGAAAGALAVAVWRGQIERRLGGMQGSLRRHCVGPMALLVCWAGYQWYPFFPALGRTALRAALAALLHARRLPPAELWANAAECFAVAILLETCWRRIPWAAIALALASCLARLFVRGRILAPEEVVGAAIGLALWLLIRRQRRPVLAAGMLAVAIILRELAPFRFTAFPAPFHWVPFAASIMAERQAALLMLLRKAFDYGAMVWLLFRLGLPYRISGPLVAAALLICEWAQRYIPGRTPETTDAVLAALMAALLPVLSRHDDAFWKAE